MIANENYLNLTGMCEAIEPHWWVWPSIAGLAVICITMVFVHATHMRHRFDKLSD